jgi:thioredoxin-like negative regulator of GroEL
VLLKAAQYATGAAVGGVGGVLTVRSVKAHAHEHDLTRMGQGKPTVVQVHDPTCPTCTALQRQTRAALSSFGECDMLYLVADIKTDEGAMFASRYGVPHVTLLLFDADGELQETLTGMRYEDELKVTLNRFAQSTKS